MNASRRSRIVALVVLLAAAGGAPASRRGPVQRLRELARERVLVVAHRGDARRCPENTLPAFRAARTAGADLVEFDVRPDGSGRFVCLHDATLDRTTNVEEVLGRREVEVATVSPPELGRLDAGSWKGGMFDGTRVPTLRQALAAIAPPLVPLLERKAGDAQELLDALDEAGARDRVLVQAFDWDFLERLHRLAPDLPLVALGDGDLSVDDLVRLRDLGCVGVHWNARALDVEEILALKKHGFLVFVYTVNDDLTAAGAAALGVDGVTTDDPARLRGRILEGFVRRPAGGGARTSRDGR